MSISCITKQTAFDSMTQSIQEKLTEDRGRYCYSIFSSENTMNDCLSVLSDREKELLASVEELRRLTDGGKTLSSVLEDESLLHNFSYQDGDTKVEVGDLSLFFILNGVDLEEMRGPLCEGE